MATVEEVLARWSDTFCLTGAELAILRHAVLVDERHDAIAIARDCFPSTVKKQVQFIAAKTNTRTLADAALRVLRETLELHALTGEVAPSAVCRPAE